MLQELPDNVIDKIFAYSDGLSLARLSLVCIRLSNLLEDRDLWLDRAVREVPTQHASEILNISHDRCPQYSELTTEKLKLLYSTWSALSDCENINCHYETRKFSRGFCKVSSLCICSGYLIVGSIDGTVQMFDAGGLHRVKEIKEHRMKISGLASHCSSIGSTFPSTVIASCYDHRISVTQYAHCKQVRDPWCIACGSGVNCLAKSGTRVVVGLQNGDVKLLNFSEAEGNLRISALHSDPHRREVESVSIGSKLAVASYGGTADSETRIFEMEDDDVPASLRYADGNPGKSCVLRIQDTKVAIIKENGRLVIKSFQDNFNCSVETESVLLSSRIVTSCSCGPLTAIICENCLLLISLNISQSGDSHNFPQQLFKTGDPRLRDVDFSRIQAAAFGSWNSPKPPRSNFALIMIDDENTCHYLYLR